MAEPAARMPAVLVVEDHALQRHALCALLRRAGAQRVLEAADGEAALALLDEAAGDALLVVTDLDMPRMDGIEFIRHLAARAPAAHLVIVSVHDQGLLRSVRLLAQQLGVRRVTMLPKPVRLAQIEPLLRPAPDRLAQPGASSEPLSGAEVRQALAAGWLRAYYQPKLSLAGTLAIGCEALARIDHPRRGLLRPAQFLPALYEAGLQRALTDRMVEGAGALLHAVRDACPALTVSINLTLPEVSEPRDAERLAAVVRAAGIAPQRVVLEVTETALATHWAQAVENLARLRMRGFLLSIDDYGTGYSSLRQLMHLPFSELKLDRSFVRDLAVDPAARVVVESTIDMAARLGLTTVAEGLETAAETQALRELGCDVGQGYRLARPMPLDACVAWLQDQARPAASVIPGAACALEASP